jgi:hypothetical protein
VVEEPRRGIDRSFEIIGDRMIELAFHLTVQMLHPEIYNLFAKLTRVLVKDLR